MNYADWSREKLIEHITAYSEALHELAGVAMKQDHEIRKLRARVAHIDAVRGWFHAA